MSVTENPFAAASLARRTARARSRKAPRRTANLSPTATTYGSNPADRNLALSPAASSRVGTTATCTISSRVGIVAATRGGEVGDGRAAGRTAGRGDAVGAGVGRGVARRVGTGPGVRADRGVPGGRGGLGGGSAATGALGDRRGHATGLGRG